MRFEFKHICSLHRPDFGNESFWNNAFCIGVPDPAIFSQCLLGRLKGVCEAPYDSSACSRALGIAAPGFGSKIVSTAITIDTVTAMAILLLNGRGQSESINLSLVGRISTLEQKGWHNVNGLFTVKEFADKAAWHAIKAIVYKNGHWGETLAARVNAVADVISGTMTPDEIDRIAGPIINRKPEFHLGIYHYDNVPIIFAPQLMGQARKWIRTTASPFSFGLIIDPYFVKPGWSHSQQRLCVVWKYNNIDYRGFISEIDHREAGARGIHINELHESQLGWHVAEWKISSPKGPREKTFLTLDQVVEVLNNHLRSSKSRHKAEEDTTVA